MQSEDQRNRFLGAVLGVCIGDALGAQFEGKSGSVVQMMLEDQALTYTGDKRADLKPGEWTDDAGQFIAVVNSFYVNKGFEELDVAGALTGWGKHHPKRIGMHTKEIVNGLRVDLDGYQFYGQNEWIESAGVKAGNGSLVRCLVPGLFYSHDLEQMIPATIATSQMTHFDPRCVETALVLNFLLMECLNDRFSIESLEYAQAFLQGIRESQYYVNRVKSYDRIALAERTNFTPYLSYGMASDAVIHALSEMKTKKYTDLHTTGYCVHTLQVVCYALLNATDFESGMQLAVQLGGDSDTQGAITGCLLGAQYGMSGIKSEWRTNLSKFNLIASQGDQLLQTCTTAEERDFESGQRKPQSPPPPIA